MSFFFFFNHHPIASHLSHRRGWGSENRSMFSVYQGDETIRGNTIYLQIWNVTYFWSRKRKTLWDRERLFTGQGHAVNKAAQNTDISLWLILCFGNGDLFFFFLPNVFESILKKSHYEDCVPTSSTHFTYLMWWWPGTLLPIPFSFLSAFFSMTMCGQPSCFTVLKLHWWHQDFIFFDSSPIWIKSIVALVLCSIGIPPT